MAEPTIADFVAQVEDWQRLRVEEASAFSLRGFRGFVEQMNYRTRKLISFADRQDPEFWGALAELATNAQTLVTPGAQLRADHRNVKNL